VYIIVLDLERQSLWSNVQMKRTKGSGVEEEEEEEEVEEKEEEK
jgi:hypothetical protein